jgi:hypothetical protein
MIIIGDSDGADFRESKKRFQVFGAVAAGETDPISLPDPLVQQIIAEPVRPQVKLQKGQRRPGIHQRSGMGKVLSVARQRFACSLELPPTDGLPCDLAPRQNYHTWIL